MIEQPQIAGLQWVYNGERKHGDIEQRQRFNRREIQYIVLFSPHGYWYRGRWGNEVRL